ncbi:hypothetical protein [Motilibacter deserti]|uniref:Uncharacterized protein n=1 Tax=Motilibacter deserti TaxID=2714956 RepID=A0ABX0GSX2_9ACTN|nr:hypothetical protein [Motilibacter deserti]NHC13600.1 hypothetical protein [Motilibacter deserti]
MMRLQAAAGNRAVSALAAGAGDGHTNDAHKNHRHKNDGAGRDEPDRGVHEGAVEDVVGQAEAKGAEEGAEDAAGAGRLPVVASLTLAEGSGSALSGPGHARPDAVASALTMASTTTRSGTVSPFGAEYVTYSIRNPTWRTAGGVIHVGGQVGVDTTWNTNSGGNTNVAGANDPAVTATTWRAAADDLTPDATGRPPRTSYWAADLTERHEQFHAADDIARARLYLPAAGAWLNTQTVDVSWFDFVTSRRVAALLELARQRIEADGWAWYDRTGGAGENRAYADGRAAYQGRADAVRSRAATEGWT